MATSANFNPAIGVLSVLGDAQTNSIKVSRNPAGAIRINGGAVPVSGGVPTTASTSLIQVFGQDGNDTILLDETQGALPAALLFGGAGNDTITGGSSNDELFGQAGNDTLRGLGGDDLLFGGDGNDVLIGGAGDDQMFGGAGNDRMIWNPGDGTDLMEGGEGFDTAEVNGGNGAETFTITANGTRVRFDRVSPAPFSLDIGTTESLVLRAGGGDDVITAGNGLAGLIQLTLDGGAGNDTITGGDGDDLLLGGDGNDVVTGGRGSDTALLGTGDDTFIWNPGDGSDVVEGQAGFDTLVFNGANINETMSILANGGRVTLTRNVGNITMDLNGVERVAVTARGGADLITVGDLSGTAVKQVALDLSGQPGSGVGDGAADTVVVLGTAGGNHITLAGAAGAVTVAGLPVQTTITGIEGANDRLVVQALGGNDVLDAGGLAAGVIGLTLDGGAGNDTIIGSGGDDLLIGGDGNDAVTGGRGNDVAFLGQGDDSFVWNPGDGSDVVEGQDGFDTLRFNGSGAGEQIDIGANGGRVRLFRDVGAVTMDLNGVERIALNAAGGPDGIVVEDLQGTGVAQVAIDLAGAGGTADGEADQVTVNGTAAADTITIARIGGVLTVNGLAAQVTAAHADGALDTLVVNGQGGDDRIDASALRAGQIGLLLNGGDGADLIIGSAGADTILGGRGNDVAFMGAGNDTFIWNPGDGSDVIEGQGGFDTLQFNGSNANENINLSANGERVRLFRDVGAVTMDVNGVENVQIAMRGGADTMTVGDLSGTAVRQVTLDLGAGSFGGDGQPDTVVLNATGGNDVIRLSSHDGVVTVSGLPVAVTLTNVAPIDRIVINGLGGNDVIDASGLGVAMRFLADGGEGDDLIIGSAGDDTLSGGGGDDVLLGGPGTDILDGGTGSNILIQSALAAPAAFALHHLLQPSTPDFLVLPA